MSVDVPFLFLHIQLGDISKHKTITELKYNKNKDEDEEEKDASDELLVNKRKITHLNHAYIFSRGFSEFRVVFQDNDSEQNRFKAFNNFINSKPVFGDQEEKFSYKKMKNFSPFEELRKNSI